VQVAGGLTGGKWEKRSGGVEEQRDAKQCSTASALLLCCDNHGPDSPHEPTVRKKAE
jgi:hypothetical protein